MVLSKYFSMKFAGLLILLAITDCSVAESLRSLGLMQKFGAAGDFAFTVVQGGALTSCDLVATSSSLIMTAESGCILLAPSNGAETLLAGQSYHISNSAVLNNYINYGVAVGCVPPTYNDQVNLLLYCSSATDKSLSCKSYHWRKDV
jgi:hypothetical protein